MSTHTSPAVEIQSLAQLIFDSTNDVMFLIRVEPDGEFICLAVNQAYLKATRLQEAQVAGKNIRHILPDEALATALRGYNSAITTRSATTYHEKIDFGFGEDIVETTITPVIDPSGRCTHLIGTSKDLKPMKMADQKNRMLLQTFKGVNECLCVTNMHDEILFVNDAFLKTYGYDNEQELLNNSIAIVNPGFDSQATIADVTTATKNGGWQGELWNKKKNGEVFQIQLSTSPVYNEEGQITAMIGIANDITERKANEKTLIESEERYRLLAENSSDIIALYDKDFRLLYMSPAGEQLSGYTLEEAQNLSIWDLVHPDDREKVMRASEASLKQKKISNSVAYRFVAKDGRLTWIETNSTRVFNDRGELERVVAVSRDISMHKEIEELIMGRNRKVELLSRSATEMIELPDLPSIYKYICNNIHQIYRDTIVLFVTIDEERMETTLTEVAGLESVIFRKVADLTGFNPLGKKYRLLPSHHKIFKRAHFREFQGGLAEFAASEFPELIANLIQKILGITHIYTIGINKGKKLLSAVHIFARHNNKITDAEFVETLIKQAGIIIERKMLEEQMRFQATILDQISDRVTVTDLDGVITYINKAEEKMMKLTSGDILGKTVKVYGENPQEGATQDEIIEKTLAHGEWRGEIVNYPADGTELFLEVRTKVITDIHNNPIAMCGISTDISGRKKNENELVRKEKRYRDLVENLNDVVFSLDARGFFTFVSPVVITFTGHDPAEMIGKHFTDFIHPDDLPATAAETDYLNQKPLTDYECRLLTITGNEIWIRCSIRLNFNDRNSPEYTGIAQNITRQKEAEFSLKESEAQFKSLFDNAADAIFIAGMESGIILEANEAATRLLMIPRESLIGLHQTRLHPSGEEQHSRQTFLQQQAELKKGGPAHTTENTLIREDGTEVVVEILASKVLFKGEICQMGTFRDITSRKRAEQALQESETRFKILHNASFGGIVIHDQGVILDCNRGLSEMTGYPLGELMQMDLLLLIAPGSRNHVKEKINQQYEKPYEATGLRQNGEEYPLRLEARNIPFKGKEVRTVEFRDITDLKASEQKLQYQSDFRKLLIEISSNYINMPLGAAEPAIRNSLGRMGEFVAADRVYTFSYDWNLQTCTNTYEWCAEGIEPQIDVLQDVPLAMMPDWVTAHQQGQPMFVADVAALPPGEVREILEPQGIKSVIAVPLMHHRHCIGFVGFDSVSRHHVYTDEEQQLLKVFAQMLVNIELRKTMELDLIHARVKAEEGEQKVRSMFENTLAGILFCNGVGTIIEANPAALRIMGSPSLEASKTVNLLTHKPLQDIGFSQNLQKSIQEKQIVSDEVLYTSKWGKTVFIKYFLIPIVINDTLMGVWANLQDLTDLWQTQNDLKNAKEKAEESDKLKTAFLLNMSHEIRTPMNGIIGFINLLDDAELEENDKQDYIAIINKSSQRLLDTINDIIEISKIESGHLEVTLSNVNLGEVMKFHHDFFKQQTDEKGLQLTCLLPTIDTPRLIKTDRHKLDGILSNLLKNAVKFTKTGKIEFGLSQHDQALRFFVKDTGIGIPANRLEAVFERFIQADNNVTRPYEGSGLGLTITKAYVTALGGKIEVSSEEGIGTTFYFSIPYHPSTDQKKPSASDVEREAIAENHLILIAEDDDVNFFVITKMLQKENFHLIRAVSGEDTIQAVADNPNISMVLMDVKMPGMSGYDATRAIREFNPHIPILAQTAHAFVGEMDKALEAGCNDYITKPIDKNELLRKIHYWISAKPVAARKTIPK